MTNTQLAYQRLIAANPLPDEPLYETTRDEARVFLRDLVDQKTPQHLFQLPRPAKRRWAPQFLIAVLVFGAIVAAGALALLPGGGPSTSQPTAATGAPEVIEASEPEPALLAAIRDAVNRGDAATAAALHGSEAFCDRFFTEGVESCADWYGFLVAIGIEVTAVECHADGEAASCTWTVASDVHRALGVESVQWRFLALKPDGWGSAQPDRNLFSGQIGESAFDEAFWRFVIERIGEPDPVSTRVPATLDADFAAFARDAADEFPGGP